MLFSVLESVGFGLGIAFLIFGWPLVSRAEPDSRTRAAAMHLSITWVLLNWFFHDNLHIHNGHNMQGLLYIKYGFHGTLILAGAILAYGFAKMLRSGRPGVG